MRLMPNNAYDWLVLANEIAVDYDGCRTNEQLIDLIDEMKSYICNAMDLMEEDMAIKEHY